VQGLEFARRSDEDFTGRGVDADEKIETRKAEKVGALDTDLRASVLTGLRTKSVRVLCGMTRVPTADLERAWNGQQKALDDCRKGHGFGTSTDRGAQRVAEEGVGERAIKLGDEILRRVNGDVEAARGLLKDITASPSRPKKGGGVTKEFPGFTSVSQFTKEWQVSNAETALASHPVFGDAAREPGGEG